MGDITEKRRRDYSGLDADKASIPAGGKAVNDTFLATDTKILYFWDGVAWIIIPLDVIVAGMIKTDAVETAKIKDLNVTVGKLAGGITATKLAADCVETAKIKDLNVTVGKLAGGITATKLAADAVETLKIKDLNVTKGKAELGFGRYVPLPKNAMNYVVGDFTTDGNWKINALDFTGDLPAGATGIVLRLELKDEAADSFIEIRHDAAYAQSKISLFTQVANVTISTVFILPIESDRLMDYAGSNLAFTVINLTCIGYFI